MLYSGMNRRTIDQTPQSIKNPGFTLIELLVTVAVTAILLAAGVPGFSSFVQNSRIDSQLHTLYTSMLYARSEAVKRASSVSICSSNNQAQCAGNWHDGWIVFVDGNADGNRDAGDTVLKVSGALEQGNILNFKNAGLNLSYTGYDSLGLAIPNTSGTFSLCDNRGAANARGIDIAVTGRISRAVNALACP